MPETVLAVIGSGRFITRSAFLEAWDRSATAGDSLTPKAGRRFLELMVDGEVLAEAALRESWVWTPAESARYGAVRDRHMVAAALDSALDRARSSLAAAGRPARDPELVGIVARDSTVARMGVVFDEELIERLARAWSALPRLPADSSLASHLAALSSLPEVRANDLPRAVARSSLGDYRVNELFESWSRLSPVYRPRVENASQVRDLVRNGLFERALRHAAEERGLDRRADVISALSSERERIAIAHLMEREIRSKVPRDSAATLRFYREHREDWALPTRVRVIRLVLEDRAAAHQMALRLGRAAEAESLATRAERSGVRYRIEVSAATDPELFASAVRAGAGAVLGPEAVPEGWRVARVTEVLPGRPLRFDEVRDEVERQRSTREGERLMRALCDRLRQSMPVIVNNDALARVISSPGANYRGRSRAK